MLIYGDQSELIEPQNALQRLTVEYGDLTASPPGIARHAALVGLFINAAGLT